MADSLPTEHPATLALAVTPPPSPEADGPQQPPRIVIEAGKTPFALELPELWRFRDLLASLTVRDLKLRYKQTALGAVWVVLQSALSAGVFSIIFGVLAKFPTPGKVPYFVFSFAGVTAWMLFSGTLLKVSGCLVGNSHLITKVYFPRLILPLSCVGSTLVDFAISMIVLAGLLLIVSGPQSGWAVLCLPLWVALIISLAVGVGLIGSALSVSYRDVNYILPVLIQTLLYASPVAFSVSQLPTHVDWLKWFFIVNPLTGMLEGFRWSVLGGPPPGALPLALSLGATLVALWLGVRTFKRMEKHFADVI